jgi:hypothetical protein
MRARPAKPGYPELQEEANNFFQLRRETIFHLVGV